MRKLTLLFLPVFLTACMASGPPTRPNEREWTLLMADYKWIHSMRTAKAAPPASAPRKEQIEYLLEMHRKMEPAYVGFIDKLREYSERTSDPRAATLLANEKIILGDEYMTVLSRYDRAIEMYQAALQIEPTNAAAQARLEQAQKRRFVSLTTFAGVKNGMKESEVRSTVGLPREDWIKQVVQNNRVYAVWIYPKPDGGAAAIYFDNGVVYHTNWNAAAPPTQTK